MICLDKTEKLMYYTYVIGKKAQIGEQMRNIIVENNQVMSDEEVVKLIQQGEYSLLPKIIEHYMSVIVSTARGYLPSPYIDDAVQEATIAFYNAIKTYDSQRSSFSTFASLCIKRAVITFARKNGAQKNIPDELLSSLDDSEISDNSTPEAIFIAKEDYNTLTQSIRVELSKLEYEVLQLFLAGMPYSNIAEMLNISEKSVDNALSRIRKKLKK